METNIYQLERIALGARTPMQCVFKFGGINLIGLILGIIAILFCTISAFLSDKIESFAGKTLISMVCGFGVAFLILMAIVADNILQ